MTVESDADRLEMLSDFGENAVYTPAGGSGTTITAIFDTVYTGVEGLQVDLSSNEPRAFCRTADVITAASGDTLVRSSTGITYKIRVPMDDGTGMTELVLEEVS